MENKIIYIISVVFVVAFSSFCMYDSEKMKGARFALGIILISALAIPFIDSLTSVRGFSADDIPIYENEFDNGIRDEYVKAAFLKGIKLSVAEKFYLSKEEVSVGCSGFSFDEMKAESIIITLYGKAAFSDIRAIRDFVEKNGFGECEVFVCFESSE